MSTNFPTNKLKSLKAAAGIDLSSDANIKAVLCDSSVTPTKALDFMSSYTSAELVCTGYARVALSGKAVTQDNSGNLMKFTSSAIVFPTLGPASAGPTTAYLLVIKDTGSAATSPVLLVFDVVVTVNGGTLTITPAAAGLHTET